MKNKVYFLSNRNIDRSKLINDWNFVDDNFHTGFAEIEKKHNIYKIKENSLEFYFGTEEYKLNQLLNNVNNEFVLFFHGFDIGFGTSLVDCYKLQNKINKDVIVFSWPSNGKLNGKDYLEDQGDARKTAQAISYLFYYLEDKNKKIDLITHSMGGYLLRQGYQIYRQNNKISKLFNNIILVAPDEDNDTFEKEEKLKGIENLTNKVTIFYNQLDWILKYSQLAFKDNLERLGQIGVKDKNILNDKIQQFDITEDIKKYKHTYLMEKDNDSFTEKLLNVLKK